MKKVGTSLYVHKSNIEELLNCIQDELEINRILSIINIAKKEYLFEIIKYDKKSKNISLIECDTWNSMNEPIVGDSHLYKLNGEIKLIKGNKTVYHSKELFVNENYVGFDVEKAKQRTLEWNKIPNIKNLKSKIGNITYWHNLLKENNLEI